jgi:uncharacterized damage-inducible protein DinB
MKATTSSKGRATDAAKKIDEGRRRLEAIARLDADTLARPYAPGKWNGTELMAHLADADLVYYYRFLKVVAEEGAPIVPFDQDRWVVELRARDRPIAVSMASIAAARTGLVYYLAALPEEALARSTVHPESGPMTALDLAERVANHAIHHLEQLEAIRDGRAWTAK